MQWAYTNCSKLLSLLSEEDRLTYDFDITKLVWKDYVTDFAMGTKLYLLNEDPANVPIARKQIKRYVVSEGSGGCVVVLL